MRPNHIPLTDAADERLTPYRDLKDRTLARQRGLFICEGDHLVRRLIASSFRVHSIVVAEHRLPALEPELPGDVPVYVASNAIVSQLVGFDFHLGILACGYRPTCDDLTPLTSARTLVVCPVLFHNDNLGMIIRTAAALGADGLLLSDKGVDAFARRTVRVSMGAVFNLPIVQSPRLADDLGRLRSDHGFEVLATVLDEQAQSLYDYQRAKRVALMLGPEHEGLDETWLAQCDRRLTLPMHHGTDSLNVAVAAGIFLAHLMR